MTALQEQLLAVASKYAGELSDRTRYLTHKATNYCQYQMLTKKHK